MLQVPPLPAHEDGADHETRCNAGSTAGRPVRCAAQDDACVSPPGLPRAIPVTRPCPDTLRRLTRHTTGRAVIKSRTLLVVDTNMSPLWGISLSHYPHLIDR